VLSAELRRRLECCVTVIEQDNQENAIPCCSLWAPYCFRGDTSRRNRNHTDVEKLAVTLPTQAARHQPGRIEPLATVPSSPCCSPEG
jgi:hypothetical protein